LDLELSDGVSAWTVVSRAKSWLSKVHAATGKTPMIYTASGFWNAIGDPGFSSYPLFIANWGVSCPSIPGSWGNWKFWQYTDSGSVPGISGAVDRDRFNGSLADLQAFAGQPQPHPLSTNPIGRNKDGRLEVFARGTNGALLHKWQETAGGDTWSG